MINENNIILGDCLEVMKDIPDNSIGSIICDPPYGTTSLGWDSVIDLANSRISDMMNLMDFTDWE